MTIGDNQEHQQETLIWSKTGEKPHKEENPLKILLLLDCHKMFSTSQVHKKELKSKFDFSNQSTIQDLKVLMKKRQIWSTIIICNFGQ